MKIGEFEATLTRARVGDTTVALWRVAELERHVDRAALLAADAPPEPPYWAHLWSGALVLAAAVPRGAGRVLELGCGLGPPGPRWARAARRRGAHRHARLLRRAGRGGARMADARGARARGGPAAHRQAGRGRRPLLECGGVHFAIFDVETRIDKALVRAVLHRGEEIGDEEAYERTHAQIAARSRTGADFFPLAFHVPVSIVIGDVNDERVLTGVQVLGAEGYSEAGIVREFWERLERFRGTLVTFNGRGFDLPVLELAALRHGCVMPRYFKEGFRYRYSDEAHYDLYEFLNNYGAYRVRGGFHLLAQLVGLPGKRSE